MSGGHAEVSGGRRTADGVSQQDSAYSLQPTAHSPESSGSSPQPPAPSQESSDYSLQPTAYSQETSVPIITIDGPSGSGKGTISRKVAAHLGWHLLDSGALYRLVAFAGMKRQLKPEDEQGHAQVAAQLDTTFSIGPDGGEQIWLEGAEVSQQIRTEQAGDGASRVALMGDVRKALLHRQRAFARLPGLVADGRDMGTVIFPTAQLKIFLTATPEERALRRYNQLKDKDVGANLAALSLEIAERDRRDASRPIAPLKPAEDAVIVDSTTMSIEAVIARVLELAAARFPVKL